MSGIGTTVANRTKDSWETNVQARILVVDDDPTVCELIQAVLSSVEIDSLTLTSSKAAIPYLSKEKFSAIFLDVRMPAPDGIELTRQIRSSGMNRTTPIAIITGEEERSVLARAFEVGASFFLFKPIDRHRMLRLIRVSEGPVQLEARRYQRVRIQCQVSLECGERELKGTTLDLSLNGFSMQVASALPVGSAVSASLHLKSNAPPVRLGARVVRTFGEGCMGLPIEHATAEENRRLQEFLLPIILAKIDS
jgi:CheY-like chemotaxis protein